MYTYPQCHEVPFSDLQQIRYLYLHFASVKKVNVHVSKHNLFKSRCLLYFLNIFFLWIYTLTSNNIPYGVRSDNLQFIFESPIICKIINILTNQITALNMYPVLIPQDLVGWSLIWWMNIDMTPYGMFVWLFHPCL